MLELSRACCIKVERFRQMRGSVEILNRELEIDNRVQSPIHLSRGCGRRVRVPNGGVPVQKT
jgi:hypothetical protein